VREGRIPTPGFVIVRKPFFAFAGKVLFLRREIEVQGGPPRRLGATRAAREPAQHIRYGAYRNTGSAPRPENRRRAGRARAGTARRIGSYAPGRGGTHTWRAFACD